VFYPHPATFGVPIPAWRVAGAAAIIISITIAALALARRAPYLIVGWLWYLGTLVPVIGLVQIGRQAMADRYTYVPSIGLVVAIAWGVADLVGRLRLPAAVTGGAVAAVLVGCVIATRMQLRHWRDGIVMFERAAAVVPNNYIAHYNLGIIAASHHDLHAAARHYARAVESLPTYPPAQNNLAAVLEQLGDAAGAERHYRGAIAADASFPAARLNLGRLLVAKGAYDEAIEHLGAYVRLAPSPYDGYATLGFAQLAAGRTDDAIASLRAAAALRPKSATAAAAVARVLVIAGRRDDALAQYRHALSLDPDDPAILASAAWLLATDPDAAARRAHAAEAVRMGERARDVAGADGGGGAAGVLDALGAAYAAAGQFADAIRTAQAAADDARAAGDTALAAAIDRRVEGYRSGRPAGTMDAAGPTTATTMGTATRPATGTRPAPAAR
jgi:tetratricopeptide (TPR) repeat protein